jgi:hypothetical protein
MTSLADYLASMQRRRWQPGLLDCGIFLADWAIACGRPDPIADIRGTYDSARGFLRILRREDGFARSCAMRLQWIGAVATSSPAAGDLAVVLAPYAIEGGRIKRRPVGAICVSPTMRAVLTPDLGVVIAGLPVVSAWTLNG